MKKPSDTKATSKPLGEIEHVIVLMFENRSFDNVLGGLYPGRPGFDGVPSDFTNYARIDGKSVPVPAWQAPTGSAAKIMPFPDPKEDHADMMSQIFDNMSGFAQDYTTALKAKSKPVTYDNVKQIMQYYAPYTSPSSPGNMPISTYLAQQYAVSDRYFGSGPVQTWPNRLFAHCGTPGNNGSTAYINNKDYPNYGDLDPLAGQLKWKTVFEQLDEQDKSWRVYFNGSRPISAFLSYVYNHWYSYSEGNVEYFETTENDHTDFFQDLSNDNLPNYSFIEPRYQQNHFGLSTIPPNSNHPGSASLLSATPPISVDHGELMLRKIYTALLANPEVFKKTLLLVTYDEHGGVFDHVNPPTAVSPFTSTMTNYNYTQYGPRVPAIFINPYIIPATVFRPKSGYFDHTSIIATLRDQFGLAGSLTPRVASAPTFEGLLNENIEELNFGTKDLPEINLPEAETKPGKGIELSENLPEEEYGTVTYAIYKSMLAEKAKSNPQPKPKNFIEAIIAFFKKMFR
jgi:phospholipase C